MQAITTKIIPATNTKPTRIKASCERGSIIISYPHELTGDACHVAAADALCAKFIKEDSAKYGSKYNPWQSVRVCGTNKAGDCVHVFLPEKRYLCSFTGRPMGAIGIFESYSLVEVWAATEKEAFIRLCDRFELNGAFKAVESIA